MTATTDAAPTVPAIPKQKTYPRVRVGQGAAGEDLVGIEASDWAAMRQAFGVESDDVVDGLVTQIVNAKSGKRVSEGEANFALAAVKGIAPGDTVEALLAAQMVAVHLATMAAAQRLGGVDNIAQHDANVAALNKLARTFAMQVEALKRHRSKGEQRVYVERVNVEAGGQAVVGAVASDGGRGHGKRGR